MAENAVMTEPSGILVLHKPIGITSHDAVYKIRKLYGTKRVGHTGTLDPLAEGVLVMLIGRAAKAAEYLVSDKKAYKATLRLGMTTDTEDITGTVLTRFEGVLPSDEEVKNAVCSFLGETEQIPPMYSALKVDGKKLCDLARAGVVVERQPRKITVFSISSEPCDTEGDYLLDVTCSSGTYIRTLCADIGAALGCGGTMATLCRTMAGGFSIGNAVTLEQLADITEEERLKLLLPTQSLFEDLAAVRLPAFYHKLCTNGCEIYQKKIHTSFELGTRVRLCSESGEFFALGEVRDYPDGSAIKAIKFL
ncbi:MAG: tRNA pseudouridine(55) synthase TruB [Ruminococcaceae bacterium]|nr:tRNA pseudouridine(55) synthase TruB [Oscillospiraceae bacterium]